METATSRKEKLQHSPGEPIQGGRSQAMPASTKSSANLEAALALYKPVGGVFTITIIEGNFNGVSPDVVDTLQSHIEIEFGGESFITRDVYGRTTPRWNEKFKFYIPDVESSESNHIALTTVYRNMREQKKCGPVDLHLSPLLRRIPAGGKGTLQGWISINDRASMTIDDTVRTVPVDPVGIHFHVRWEPDASEFGSYMSPNKQSAAHASAVAAHAAAQQQRSTEPSSPQALPNDSSHKFFPENSVGSEDTARKNRKGKRDGKETDEHIAAAEARAVEIAAIKRELHDLASTIDMSAQDNSQGANEIQNKEYSDTPDESYTSDTFDQMSNEWQETGKTMSEGQDTTAQIQPMFSDRGLVTRDKYTIDAHQLLRQDRDNASINDQPSSPIERATSAQSDMQQSTNELNYQSSNNQSGFRANSMPKLKMQGHSPMGTPIARNNSLPHTFSMDKDKQIERSSHHRPTSRATRSRKQPTATNDPEYWRQLAQPVKRREKAKTRKERLLERLQHLEQQEKDAQKDAQNKSEVGWNNDTRIQYNEEMLTVGVTSPADDAELAAQIESPTKEKKSFTAGPYMAAVVNPKDGGGWLAQSNRKVRSSQSNITTKNGTASLRSANQRNTQSQTTFPSIRQDVQRVSTSHAGSRLNQKQPMKLKAQRRRSFGTNPSNMAQTSPIRSSSMAQLNIKSTRLQKSMPPPDEMSYLTGDSRLKPVRTRVSKEPHVLPQSMTYLDNGTASQNIQLFLPERQFSLSPSMANRIQESREKSPNSETKKEIEDEWTETPTVSIVHQAPGQLKKGISMPSEQERLNAIKKASAFLPSLTPNDSLKKGSRRKTGNGNQRTTSIPGKRKGNRRVNNGLATTSTHRAALTYATARSGLRKPRAIESRNGNLAAVRRQQRKRSQDRLYGRTKQKNRSMNRINQKAQAEPSQHSTMNASSSIHATKSTAGRLSARSLNSAHTTRSSRSRRSGSLNARTSARSQLSQQYDDHQHDDTTHEADLYATQEHPEPSPTAAEEAMGNFVFSDDDQMDDDDDASVTSVNNM